MKYKNGIPMKRFWKFDGALLKLLGVLLLAVLITLVTCGRGILVSEDTAIKAVEDLGMTDVRVVGRSNFFAALMGCSEKDAAEFDVEARNALGKVVVVTVCVGWPFKGATVRH